MIGIVIVTHGRLAVELLAAVRHIVGPQSHIETVCIGPNDEGEKRQSGISASIKGGDLGNGVEQVTDMFGCSACNLPLPHLKKCKFYGFAGVTWPTIFKLAVIL